MTLAFHQHFYQALVGNGLNVFHGKTISNGFGQRLLNANLGQVNQINLLLFCPNSVVNLIVRINQIRSRTYGPSQFMSSNFSIFLNTISVKIFSNLFTNSMDR